MSRLTSIACMLALVLMSCSLMFAQTQDVYQVTYYDNNYVNGYLDSTIRIINPGLQGSPIAANGLQGTLCANIYVFDDSQEMIECCACPVTANGLLTISVQDITENPLTVTPVRGVIKVVSTAGPTCDPTHLGNATPDLRAFATHIQNAAFGGTSYKPFLSVTEEEFADAPLGAGEQTDLGTICSFVRYLGTGRGRCDDECDEPVYGD